VGSQHSQGQLHSYKKH